jgi:cobalt-zinc-cadmium resistance protein CzcA
VTLPAGYHVEWAASSKPRAGAAALAFILPVTIAVIFTLLFFAFGSATYAGLVLLNVPFSLVGGIAALFLRGINLSSLRRRRPSRSSASRS